MPINPSAFFEAGRATSGGALSRGISRGSNIAQQFQSQQALNEQRRANQIQAFQKEQRLAQKQQFDRDVQQVNSLASVFGNKSLPTNMRTQALNQYITFSNASLGTRFKPVSSTDFEENNSAFNTLSTKLTGLVKQIEKGEITPKIARQAAVGLNLDTAKNFKQAGAGGKLIESTLEGFEPETIKAPTTRTVKRGGEFITEEFRDGQWVEVGKAPRVQQTQELSGRFKDILSAKTAFNKDSRVIDFRETQKRTDNMAAVLGAIDFGRTGDSLSFSDRSALIDFAKTLEPNAVRKFESEALTANMSFIQRVRAAISRFTKGGELTVELRQDLQRVQGLLNDAAKEKFLEAKAEFDALATETNLPQDLITTLGQQRTTQRATAQELLNQAAQELGPGKSIEEYRARATELRQQESR